MANLPDIAILIITYNRPDELRKTIQGLQEHLIYPNDKLHIIISDDSSPSSYLSSLKRTKALKEWGKNGTDFRVTEERSGWGKHVNGALEYIKTEYPSVDYVFQIEDDYVLEHELDLSIGAKLMQNRSNIGMLRYRGTAGTHCIYHQFESDDNITYLQMDNASHTLYIYSNGPHLKRIRSHDNHPDFHQHYGLYLEGSKLGDTEENFAHRVKDGMKLGDAPAIAILPDWVNMRFSHIGETWQNSEDDIGG
jgi:glycosyltransferase involved in cell wall biosynthesis